MEQVGVKGQVVDQWIERLKFEGSLLLDSTIKLLKDFEIMQSKIQGIKTTFTKEIDENERNMQMWRKMEDFDIDFLVEIKVLETRGKYVEVLSLIAHRNELIKHMVTSLEGEIKSCDNDIDQILARIVHIPCFIYGKDNQKLVTSDTIIQEFHSLISRWVEQDFTLNAFDKLLEIQVGLELLASLLKDGKKQHVKTEDAIFKINANISISIALLDEVGMKSILAKFEEFKSNEDKKDE